MLTEWLVELGLERAMVIGKDGERVSDWMELPNGCVCCTVKFVDDVVSVTKRL
jgi:G3E family GTPase